jgi:hypothetical protein
MNNLSTRAFITKESQAILYGARTEKHTSRRFAVWWLLKDQNPNRAQQY